MDRSQPVTPDDIATFQRDGAICLPEAFVQRWLDLIAEGIERNLAAPSAYAESLTSEGTSARFFSDYCNWRKIPEFRDFVYHSPAAEIVARLMGSDKVIFYREHLLIKEPGAQRETPWHHDQPVTFKNHDHWRKQLVARIIFGPRVSDPGRFAKAMHSVHEFWTDDQGSAATVKVEKSTRTHI